MFLPLLFKCIFSRVKRSGSELKISHKSTNRKSSKLAHWDLSHEFIWVALTFHSEDSLRRGRTPSIITLQRLDFSERRRSIYLSLRSSKSVLEMSFDPTQTTRQFVEVLEFSKYSVIFSILALGNVRPWMFFPEHLLKIAGPISLTKELPTTLTLSSLYCCRTCVFLEFSKCSVKGLGFLGKILMNGGNFGLLAGGKPGLGWRGWLGCKEE